MRFFVFKREILKAAKALTSTDSVGGYIFESEPVEDDVAKFRSALIDRFVDIAWEKNR